MWLFVPRFDRHRVVVAFAMLTPPVLLGALANMLIALGLADLGFFGTPDNVAVAQAAFKADVELLNISLFVVFGLLMLGALHITEDALKGLHTFGLATLLFLGYSIFSGWTFRVESVATARIALGIAFWGLGWVLIVLHLFSFLRATPHRKWTWVTGGVGLFQAAMWFLALELGIYASLEMAAFLFMVFGLVAAIVFFANQSLVEGVWGYSRRGGVKLPDVNWRRATMVLVYAVLVFGMIGAAYVHHFTYAPTWSRVHYVLLAATTPIGVVFFGVLAERGGRRLLLYGIPLSVGFQLIFQAIFDAVWPVVIAEGVMLGGIPYLFQYLAETTRALTRGTVFLFSMGAVLVLGLGGMVKSHFTELIPMDAASRIVLEFAALLIALVLAPQLPETRAQVSEEEELEDYLALAQRVRTEGG